MKPSCKTEAPLSLKLLAQRPLPLEPIPRKPLFQKPFTQNPEPAGGSPRPEEEAVRRALLAQARAGSRPAMAGLVAAYTPLLHRAARCVPPEEREDAVAEGRLHLMAAIKAYDPGRGVDLTGYLAIRMTHAMQDYRRRCLRQTGHLPLVWDDLLAEDAPVLPAALRTEGPDADDLHRQRLQRLPAAMAALSPQERTCLEALFWEGKSYVQTAEVMGVSRGRVCHLRRNALRKLRERMA